MVKFTKVSVALALILTFILPVTLWSADEVTLEIHNSFLTAGSSQTLHARVVPHYQNTSLCFGIETERFSSESCRDLDGQNAPRFHEITFKNLPAGHYIAYVLLIRAPERLAAQAFKEFLVN